MKINNRRGTNPRNRRKIEERSMAMLSPTTPIVHWWQALVPTQWVRGVQHFIVDYRQMERNKYSPWVVAGLVVNLQRCKESHATPGNATRGKAIS